MKKHIDSLSLSEIDYAVAVAQGWELRGRFKDEWYDKAGCQTHNQAFRAVDYHPATDQQQCGELIDFFEISTAKETYNWFAWTRIMPENPA